MATTKKTTTTKKTPKLTAEAVMTMYMEYVLEHGHRPASVFKFCKEHNIEEGAFYNFYGSFQGIREAIWVAFYSCFTQKSRVYNISKQGKNVVVLLYIF
mgnify:CR=1 FL=1